MGSDSLPMKNEKTETVPAKPKTTLMTLPTELHLLISNNLTYPDALSLKYVNRHFHDLVYTGVNLKIEWLIERRQLHLDCPVCLDFYMLLYYMRYFFDFDILS